MKRLILGLAALLALCSLHPADAQTITVGGTGSGSLPYKPTAKGYSQISSATLAAATGLSAPANSNYCIVQPEGGAVRFRDDGTAPTASVGYLLTDGQPYLFSGATQLAAAQFINATYGGAAQLATLNILCEQ